LLSPVIFIDAFTIDYIHFIYICVALVLFYPTNKAHKFSLK